ncbi:hypothetical protein Glove_137g142 [Diversispora epigaea]|uniref:Uncharacterized protein n=1 Tax=Diversispora epigaea TaxID=1348612 RepID=A0A397J5F9_9GLOM|nr:hypothetical protein Glove_137g142 [Diversispora epigaea]
MSGIGIRLQDYLKLFKYMVPLSKNLSRFALKLDNMGKHLHENVNDMISSAESISESSERLTVKSFNHRTNLNSLMNIIKLNEFV